MSGGAEVNFAQQAVTRRPLRRRRQRQAHRTVDYITLGAGGNETPRGAAAAGTARDSSEDDVPSTPSEGSAGTSPKGRTTILCRNVVTWSDLGVPAPPPSRERTRGADAVAEARLPAHATTVHGPKPQQAGAWAPAAPQPWAVAVPNTPVYPQSTWSTQVWTPVQCEAMKRWLCNGICDCPPRDLERLLRALEPEAYED